MIPEEKDTSLEIHHAVDDLFAFFEEHPEIEKKLVEGREDEIAGGEVYSAFLKWREAKKARN